MTWKKLFNGIGNFLLTVIFIVLAFIIGMVGVSKFSGEEPNVFGYQLKTVLSGSMEPSIQTGSIIVVHQTDGNDHFSKGDVVTFQTEERILVTHRIVEMEGNKYITKGDNNDGVDVHPVMASNIVGKYTGITIPFVGYVIGFANSKPGSALFLIIPGIFLIGYSILKIVRSFKKVKTQ